MNELHAHAGSGLTLYAVLLDANGKAWNGAAFETISGAAWASYDIALTEATAGIYLATMPAVATGVYSYVVYERAGGSPATSDAQRGGGWLAWDGSNEIVPSSGGSGALTFTYTLTSAVDGSPIPDADVWVTSDSAGNNLLASGRTNASGVVTFYLDAGTVYVWRQKSGWDFVNPDTEVVA